MASAVRQAVCQNNEVKCWDVVGGECGVVCEEALHKYPSARTFDVCRYPYDTGVCHAALDGCGDDCEG